MEDIISIIVPMYNVENKIDECIKSILKQSYVKLDIILIDDGSIDSTYEICEKYSNVDERITLVHQENKGVSVARNYGIDIARGKYIMFLDADDYLDNRICEVLLKNIKKNNCDIQITNKIFHINGEVFENILYKEKEFCRENKERDLFILDLMTSYYDTKMNDVKYLSCGVTAKLFYSKIIKDNKIKFLENCHFGEDVLFNLNIFEKARKIGYIEYNGYHFNVSPDSSTHKFRDDWKISHEKFVNGIEAYILKNKTQDARFLETLEMMRVTRISGLINSYFFNKENPKKFIEKYKEFRNFITQNSYKKSINKVKFKLLTKSQKIIVAFLKMHCFLILAIICYINNR